MDPSEDLYQWSKEELTPLELLERYKDKFPRIVKVKEGFCGTHAWESLSQAEILLIHCSTSQKRVIAKDPQGRWYSFATTFDANFYPIKHKKRHSRKSKPLTELLHHYPFPFDVEAETEESCVLTTGVDEQSRPMKLQYLTITDAYEERFMKANLIRPEGLNRQVLKIAAYVKAKLVVSQSETIIHKVVAAAGKIDLTAQENSQQILMYSKQTVEQHEEENLYETLEPSKTLATPAVYETISRAAASGYVECGHINTPFFFNKPSINHLKTSARLRRPSLPNIYTQTPIPILPPKPSLPPRQRRNSEDIRVDLNRKPSAPCGEKWKGIPSDSSVLTCDELVDCLRLLNLEKFCDQFRQNQIDGALLKTLEAEDLKSDLQMTGLEAKKLLMFSREGWRPNETLRTQLKADHSGSTKA